MGFNSSSGGVTAEITGSVNTSGIPVPDSTQTLICEQVTGTGANQTAYTVPADKIFYLYALMVNHGASWSALLYDHSDTEIFRISRGDLGIKIVNPSIPMVKYTAAQNVRLNGTSGAEMTIMGILVDA